MIDVRLDIVVAYGGWMLTDAHGAGRVFSTSTAAIAEARRDATRQEADGKRVAIYLWDHGHEKLLYETGADGPGRSSG
ncbi:MAG: hypothetical protein HY834_04050 [Devosia nanyangense]|uniref:DUF2188 domain-containing protein n=1 Tax=Devosia nanyangense TaxID=1228055 RepID=A0A933L0E9_9HYPH|nr:hypothetical protein [Devosia nanyangense]